MPPVILYVLYLGYLVKYYKCFILIRVVSYKMVKILILPIMGSVSIYVKIEYVNFCLLLFLFNIYFQNTSPNNYIKVKLLGGKDRSHSSCNLCF